MKQNKLFLGLATMFAAAFAFTACSSDDAGTQSVQQDRTIRLTSSLEKGGTRSTTDPQSGTSLSTSSNLAIWAINTTADPDVALEKGNNEQYTVDNSGNLAPSTSGHTMNWPNEATLDFYAYAPYNSGYFYNAANDFSVATDQSTETNYLASDLVLARATGKTYNAQVPVALSFNHMLSKVNITIKEDANSNVDLANAVVSITNTFPTTTFNPSTGELGGASGDVTDITAATIAADLVEGDATSTATACAVVVPQPIAAGTEFIKIVTADSKTLIGKLSAATTLEGGNSYSMTISVGEITEPVTIVNIELGSATLVQWTDHTIGLTAYGVGDYVLTDGTFMKASDYSSASTTEKNKIAGIIFSTKVSDDDKDEYNAYAMGLKRMKQKFPTNGTYKSQMCTTTNGFSMIDSFEDAFNDLKGRARTEQMMKTGETYYGTLGDNQSSFIANLSWYTRKINANASDWYLPSFGQLIQIFNNLGGLSITSSSYTVDGSSNVYPYVDNVTSYIAYGDLITTLNAKINVVKGHVQITGAQEIFSDGNIVYASSTENGSGSDSHYGKIWGITFKSSSGWGFGKNISRTNNADLSVIPVVAVKLPAVAQQ